MGVEKNRDLCMGIYIRGSILPAQMYFWGNKILIAEWTRVVMRDMSNAILTITKASRMIISKVACLLLT